MLEDDCKHDEDYKENEDNLLANRIPAQISSNSVDSKDQEHGNSTELHKNHWQGWKGHFTRVYITPIRNLQASLLLGRLISLPCEDLGRVGECHLHHQANVILMPK